MLKTLLFVPSLGLAIGFLSGFFGLGGGVVSTPILRLLLHTSELIALGTPLPATIPTALAGLFVFLKHGKVDRCVALWCAVGGLGGSVLGSLATAVIPGKALMLLTAALIALVGLDFITGRTVLKARAQESENPSSSKKSASLIVGLLGGALSGLLGIGGGLFFVPAFLFALRLPLKTALGTSLAVVCAVAIPGSVIHWKLGHVDPSLLLPLTLGMVPGALFGSKLALKANDRSLILLYGIFLTSIALLLGLGEIS